MARQVNAQIPSGSVISSHELSRFRELSGVEWPPSSFEEWRKVLVQARFPYKLKQQYLNSEKLAKHADEASVTFPKFFRDLICRLENAERQRRITSHLDQVPRPFRGDLQSWRSQRIQLARNMFEREVVAIDDSLIEFVSHVPQCIDGPIQMVNPEGTGKPWGDFAIPIGTVTHILPIVRIDATRATIEWEGVRHEVSHKWATAFQRMKEAKGQPIGLTNVLEDKPSRLLSQLPPELRALVQRADGNKGYRLSIFY